jgi:predicted nucleic acid-binding protein
VTVALSGDLETTIPPGASLLVDTSVVLAYLAGTERTSAMAEQVFDSFVSTGRNVAAVSTVTVEELLVRPFQRGPRAVATIEGFLQHFADLRLIAVSYDVAREAARLRASTGLPTPDALIVASALVTGVDLLLTSDRSWTRLAEVLAPDLRIVTLSPAKVRR